MSWHELLKSFSDEREVTLDTSGPEPKFLEKTKEGVSLKGVLQRGRLKLMRDKTPYRMSETFSPSMITYKFCRRMKIGQLAGIVDMYYQSAKPRQQIIFDTGNAYHEIIQQYFWDIGQLYGSYYCHKCDKVYDGLVSPTQCPSGKKTHKKRHMEYREVKIKDEEYKISGRADGIILIDGKEHLMDIKSIGNRTEKTNPRQFCFEDLKQEGPKEFHIIQLNFYMHFTGIHQGHLLYVSRNDGQILSFAIPYDYSVIEPYLKEIKYLIDCSHKLLLGTLDSLPDCCDDETCQCYRVLLNGAKQ